MRHDGWGFAGKFAFFGGNNPMERSAERVKVAGNQGVAAAELRKNKAMERGFGCRMPDIRDRRGRVIPPGITGRDR